MYLATFLNPSLLIIASWMYSITLGADVSVFEMDLEKCDKPVAYLT